MSCPATLVQVPSLVYADPLQVVGQPERAIVHEKLPSVFIVDDEHIIAETLTVILQKSGFAARCFTDPLEALVAVRMQPPDLILSDVMMPELSGVDLAIAIQKEFPVCKVILFSGHAQTTDLLLVAREQGHDFSILDKPFHPADLLRRIRQELPR